MGDVFQSEYVLAPRLPAISHGDLKRLPLLDAVRGIAILLVLGSHYFAEPFSHRVPLLAPLTNLLWTGVDLFFILSGFLLGGILLRHRDTDAYFIPFYGRRALRILPLYIFCLALFFMTEEARAEPVWPFAFFVQNIDWAIEGRWGAGMMVPTWSLAVEEQFYLILPLLIRFCPPKALPALLSGLIVAAPLFRAASQWLGYPYAAYFLLPCRMDALFLGVLIAWWLANRSQQQPVLLRRPLTATIFGLLAIAYVALFFTRQTALNWGMSVGGYSVVALFYGACLMILLDGKHHQWAGGATSVLSLFGIGAYSIYLFHLPMLHLIMATFGPSILTLASATTATLLLACGCWLFVEKPCISLGHRVFPYRSH
jgi:peptidoglycan/LPS O-acetylase OafA/YrhL